MKNVIKTKKKFRLEEAPVAFVVSVHIRNMMATYGEKAVKEVFSELFLNKTEKKKEAV